MKIDRMIIASALAIVVAAATPALAAQQSHMTSKQGKTGHIVPAGKGHGGKGHGAGHTGGGGSGGGSGSGQGTGGGGTKYMQSGLPTGQRLHKPLVRRHGAPRDVHTGLSTGKRMHKPYVAMHGKGKGKRK
jgi:hypothetical protein